MSTFTKQRIPYASYLSDHRIHTTIDIRHLSSVMTGCHLISQHSLHAKDDVWRNVIHFTEIFYRHFSIAPIMSGRMIWQYEALWIVALQPLNRFKGFLFVWLQLV